MQARIKERVAAAVQTVSATGDSAQLKQAVREIIQDEMQATNLPAAFVDALVALFGGTLDVGAVVALGMRGAK